MKRIFFIVIPLVVSACAASPGSIKPVYVNPVVYNSYDCDQLGVEEARLQNALSAVSKEQSEARRGDAWGVALFGVPVSSVSGKNVAAQVAQAKGNVNAVHEEQSIKNCSNNMNVSTAAPSVQ
ncbi:MAG: hypothetical protein ABF636_03970 [Acetobacter sp.]